MYLLMIPGNTVLLSHKSLTDTEQESNRRNRGNLKPVGKNQRRQNSEWQELLVYLKQQTELPVFGPIFRDHIYESHFLHLQLFFALL